jgi:hypothetical protein
VQRPRHRIPLRGACLLLAAGLALVGRDAMAQITMAVPDPLAPQLDSDPDNPPRFEQSGAPARVQARTPSTFMPPLSGAGTTGFDSTNARKNTKAKPKPVTAMAQAPVVGTAPATVPPPPSPYQVPQIPPDEADTALAAAPPGTPPVGDIGPIRKLPPKRKAHSEPEDPYAPLGVRVGAFDLFPAVELIGGYDTNPGQVQNGKAAWLYTVAPELRAQSNWSRHELKADLRGSYTGYNPDQTPTLSRPYVNGKVDGRIDVTGQTRVDLGGRVLVSTDNPGSPNLQAGLAKLPIYTTVGGSAGIGHRFNRFDLSIKGDAERTVYQKSELTDGTSASNDDRNYDQFSGTLRGGYELLPGVTPFAEAIADRREHDLQTDFSGYQRDSRGLTGKLGSTFKLSHALTGEIAVGYTKRTYDDPRLENLAGLIGDASLVWTASALTTVKLTGSSVVGESTQAGVSGVLNRDVGLQVDHAFRRWLVGSVKTGFGDDDYVGSVREDRRYSVGAGLTYKFNRGLQLKGEFRQSWLHSNIAGNSYAESVFLLGLRVQR